jgi:hypothetical protein
MILSITMFAVVGSSSLSASMYRSRTNFIVSPTWLLLLLLSLLLSAACASVFLPRNTFSSKYRQCRYA